MHNQYPHGKYAKAYIVLGGNGWTLKEYYTSGRLEKHLKHENAIDITDLDTFVAKANKGEL